MNVVIYKITILTTGKSYVGVTNNLTRRVSQHKCCAKNRCTNRKGMYIDWICGGIDNYNIEVLDTFEFTSQEDSWKRESLYIEKFNTEQYGYNVAYYGCKSKISKLKGTHLSPERKLEFLKTAWHAGGNKNASANRYYIVDNDNNEYICECRTDIMAQLNLSMKQVKGLISCKNEWYIPRCHINNKYVNDARHFKLLKVEKIN